MTGIRGQSLGDQSRAAAGDRQHQEHRHGDHSAEEENQGVREQPRPARAGGQVRSRLRLGVTWPGDCDFSEVRQKRVSASSEVQPHPIGFLLRTDSLSLLSESIQSARRPSLNRLLALFWKKKNWGYAVFCPLSSLGSTPRPSLCTDRKPTKWEICAGSSIDSTTSCQTGRTDTKWCAGKKRNKQSA